MGPSQSFTGLESDECALESGVSSLCQIMCLFGDLGVLYQCNTGPSHLGSSLLNKIGLCIRWEFPHNLCMSSLKAASWNCPSRKPIRSARTFADAYFPQSRFHMPSWKSHPWLASSSVRLNVAFVLLHVSTSIGWQSHWYSARVDLADWTYSAGNSHFHTPSYS